MKLTPHLRFLFRNLHNPDSEPSLDWFAMRLEKQGIFLNNHLFFFHNWIQSTFLSVYDAIITR